MSNDSKEMYKCPECGSEKIRYKFKVNNNDKNRYGEEMTRLIFIIK